MTYTEAKALYEFIIKDLSTILFYGILIVIVINYLQSPDNSDKSRWSRSGLTVYTDALTGCQYLSKGGNLIPRLNAQGKQICETPK